MAFSPNGHLLASANFFSSNLSVWQGGALDVQISASADQQTYTQNQSVSTSFACTDPPGAGGISSCTDSNAASSPTGTLDTSTLSVLPPKRRTPAPRCMSGSTTGTWQSFRLYGPRRTIKLRV